MTGIDRRAFIGRSAAVVGAAALAGPYAGFVAPAGASSRRREYGRLRSVRDKRDGMKRLELPPGFRYRTFHQAGTELKDGTTIPGRHDGMAAFDAGRGRTILVRNQEINGPVGAYGDPSAGYDPLTGGGTISVLVNRWGHVLDDWVSLNGTQMNCAGGRTPWGSWLSCEETVNGDDVGDDFTGQSNDGLAPHGYVFEVPARGESDRVPIRAAGRFAHEAAAVDPHTGYVYLTEDNFNFPSGLYRYLAPENPMDVGRLTDGGRLQMLKVVGVDQAQLQEAQAPGAAYDVEWVDIDDPDPTFPAGTTNDEAIQAVGNQGRAQGAAVFSRLEGCTYDGGRIYFVSTQGGATVAPDEAPFGFGDGRGQVWVLDPAASTLQLAYESPGSDTLDLPDNVVASRTGALVLCEDGRGDNFLRGLTPDGHLFDFARNRDPEQEGQEFAGAAFSPDYSTLFVNIQSSTGYTVAIWGAWKSGPFG
ncbi:MAG: alkaline phosphatase PhoX [Actinomycetota bacterium]